MSARTARKRPHPIPLCCRASPGFGNARWFGRRGGVRHQPLILGCCKEASHRKRWLIASLLTNKLAGTYWGIGGSASEYGVQQGYSERPAKGCTATIRTDLDSFPEKYFCKKRWNV